jgi:hypothetical protein
MREGQESENRSGDSVYGPGTEGVLLGRGHSYGDFTSMQSRADRGGRENEPPDQGERDIILHISSENHSICPRCLVCIASPPATSTLSP